MEHVAGYCVVNDVSERAFQTERSGQWTKGKSHDTFGPIGPWLVTRDEVADPQDLAMWLEVDGHRYQDGSTRTMVYQVPFLISYLSQFMSLQPATSSPPAPRRASAWARSRRCSCGPARPCGWASTAWASRRSAPSRPDAGPGARLRRGPGARSAALMLAQRLVLGQGEAEHHLVAGSALRRADETLAESLLDAGAAGAGRDRDPADEILPVDDRAVRSR